MRNRTLLFIDADDTLWGNEEFFRAAEDEFADILSPYTDGEGVRKMLWHKQEENIPLFGYGSKTYLIGMLDAAMNLCGGQLSSEVYYRIKGIITRLAFHKVEVFEGVEKTLKELSRHFKLVLATKGDAIEQLSKVRESGLYEYFAACEVMQDKSERDYLALCRKYSIKPENLFMVGNSVRSDIIPVVKLGGTAVYIPYHITWDHEVADFPICENAIELKKFSELTGLLL